MPNILLLLLMQVQPIRGLMLFIHVILTLYLRLKLGKSCYIIANFWNSSNASNIYSSFVIYILICIFFIWSNFSFKCALLYFKKWSRDITNCCQVIIFDYMKSQYHFFNIEVEASYGSISSSTSNSNTSFTLLSQVYS